jgi:hypothetical protein
MADIEMMSDLLIGLLHGPQGGSPKIIDSYYEQYEQFEDEFPGQNKVKRIFDKTLETIRELFPNIGDASRWGNRADFYSLFVAIGNMLANHGVTQTALKELRGELLQFGSQVDLRLEKPTAKTSDASRKYARAIEKGVNDKARRSDRHEALLEIFKPFFKNKR